MILRFTAIMSNQKPSLRSGSQKRHPDPKSTSSVQCEDDFDCFLIGCVIHHEFVPRGQTVSKEYYLKIMKRLREAARRRKPGLWRGKSGRYILTTLRLMPPFWLVIFSNNMRRRSSPASVLARPCTSGLIFLHQAEIHAERTTI